MRKLRSTCRVWNGYCLDDMSWTCHMDRVMAIYGGVWATIMDPIRIGRETDYQDPRDLAEALEDAFHVGAYDAMRISEDAFQAMGRDQATVIQVQTERPGGAVDEALLPVFPWWIQEEDLQDHRMIRSLEISLASAQEVEIEGSYAEMTSIPGYAL